MLEDEVDPRFRQQARGATRRRRRAGRLRGLLYVVLPMAVLGLITLGILATWDKWSFGPPKITEEDLEVDFTQVESEIAERTGSFTAAFIDLPGDPMRIRLAEADTARTTKRLVPPADLAPERAAGGLILVSDVMVSTEESFITTLPSSPEDFQFFQTLRSSDRRSSIPTPVVSAPAAGGAGGLDEAFDDEGAGWGTTVDQEQEALPEFQRTEVENTISVALVRPQETRRPLVEDQFVRISAPRELAELLEDRGFGSEAAKAYASAVQTRFGVAQLTEGMVVAMRGQPAADPDKPARLVQLSLYNREHTGTLAVGSDGQLEIAADPWVGRELFDYTEEEAQEQAQEQSYRMLDAFYSTAIRNRVPSVLVGEAIALLSRAHDLDAFANPGDRMQLLYAKDQSDGAEGLGQILYISLTGQAVDIECYVHRGAGDEGYRCFGAEPEMGAAGGAAGMVTPVKAGVLTSRFGPRTHPILKTVRIHAGVDWAAPTGTPVVAAFAGRVDFAGDGGGYGNLVKIAHPGGFETRYAHLSKFATTQGKDVAAGELIGYIGTTGLSTGPHLHFELRQRGEALDPLVSAGLVAAAAGGGAAVAVVTGPASDAVEQLVNRIIHVESAGNSRAKNPLSTATGLGQFIESTWIRMMQTYRPDLVASLSRAQLLELRFDPTISREMVKNLAREGEAYLRARGHGITAGRLYLCHFLGAEGAHKVLSAPDDATVLAVMGPGVIGANPFLRGKTIAYIKEWAERKMSGKGYSAPVVADAPPVVIEPPEVEEYRKTIRTLLGIG